MPGKNASYDDGPIYTITPMNLRYAIFVALCLAGTARGAEYELTADSEVVGEIQLISAVYEDTFIRLARRYNVGYRELLAANPGVDPWLPGEGTEIVIPTRFVLPRAERQGIVINVPELRLYYFPDGESGRVITHPISVGRIDWRTPLGRTSIVAKTENPAWYPPQSIRDEHAARNDPLPVVVPPGPENPLGKYALRLGIPGYLIHGTNKPAGLGMRVSHGCIRMFPEDIEALFSAVSQGTSVTLVNQPMKLGWGNDGLYLEAHAPLEEESDTGEWTATELTRVFVAATAERRVEVSWNAAERVMNEALGVPRFVSVERIDVSGIEPLPAPAGGGE
jgi:L,D-transpeptidase ErfK/SrfK